MKRDQTVYTCDGCRHTQAYDLNHLPPGWYVVTTQQLTETLHKEPLPSHLCLKCFAGIDWIIRFQGLTMPPKVITEPTPLRSHRTDTTPATEDLASDGFTGPNDTAGHEPTALAAERGEEPVAIDGIRVDMKTLDGPGYWVTPPHREYYTPGRDQPDYVKGTLRGNWPRLGIVEVVPSESGEQYVTHVELHRGRDGWLYRDRSTIEYRAGSVE